MVLYETIANGPLAMAIINNHMTTKAGWKDIIKV